MTAELEKALSGILGGEVTGLEKLSGGASRDTWSFDIGNRGYILRQEPAGVTSSLIPLEAAAIRAAGRAGVPVPVVAGTGDSPGGPYMVMERLSGETIPRRLLRDDRFAGVRPRLARELGGILARLHRVSPEEVPGLPLGDQLDDLVAIYEELHEPRPSVELALQWLRRNRPAPVAPKLVHGDFRTGNLMIDDTGVQGVLDWELTHAGDPAEDLGWLCVRAWQFGGPGAAGGFGSRAELLAGYAEAGGPAPTLETLRWWEVYGTLRWAILCRVQAERHLSGAQPSMELATLGRRVCEQEQDLLLLLGLTEPEDAEDPLRPPDLAYGATPHDRPSADALIDAVAGFLSELAAADPGVRFHARVAATALRTARRELALAAPHQEAHRKRLAAHGFASDAELAQAIREGNTSDEVVTIVREAVRDRLLVANPRHLSLPVQDPPGNS